MVSLIITPFISRSTVTLLILALCIQCTHRSKFSETQKISIFFEGFHKDKISVYINGVLVFHADSLVSSCCLMDYAKIRVPVLHRKYYRYEVIYNERYSKFSGSKPDGDTLPRHPDRKCSFVVNHKKDGYNIQLYFYPPYSERELFRKLAESEDIYGFSDIKYNVSKDVGDFICAK